MRLMRGDAPNVGGYLSRHELVSKAITGKEGIAHVRAAYDGFFSDYAFPGGYSVLFTTDRGDCLCATCAKREFIMSNIDVTAGTYDEGPILQCDECGTEIESSYGDPDEEEE